MRRRETTPTRAQAATRATQNRDLGKEKIGHLDRHKLIQDARRTLPMTRIVQFATAPAMRPDGICRADRSDLDTDRRMRLTRDGKDLRNEAGNGPATMRRLAF